MLYVTYDNANVKKDASGQDDESVDAATVERALPPQTSTLSCHKSTPSPNLHRTTSLHSSQVVRIQKNPTHALNHEQYTRVLHLRAHDPALAQRLTHLWAQVSLVFPCPSPPLRIFPISLCPFPCYEPIFPCPLCSLPHFPPLLFRSLPLLLHLVPFFPVFPHLPPSLLSLPPPPLPLPRFPPFSAFALLCSLICPSHTLPPPLPLPASSLLCLCYVFGNTLPCALPLPSLILLLPRPPSPRAPSTSPSPAPSTPATHTQYVLLRLGMMAAANANCFDACYYTHLQLPILLQIPSTLQAHCLATIFDHHFLSNSIGSFTHDHGVKPE
ncbi:hypothetical protein B0H14DRAFT_3456192 [Mycena olivaceomarginata]|nr:hypothetical protein B0H14DRAFT_3456192 [Mycena olivaceomarginata]